MLDKFRRLTADISVYGVGNFLSKFAALITIPFFTRLFSPAEYGVIDVIATVTSLLAVLIVLGFDSAQHYYFYRDRNLDSKKKMLSTALAFRLSLAFLIFLISYILREPIARYALGDIQYSQYLTVSLLSIPFLVGVSFFSNTCRMFFRKKMYIVLTAVMDFFRVAVILILVFVLDQGLYGIFLGQLIAYIVFFIIGFFITKGYLMPTFDIPYFKKLFLYGSPVFFASIVMWALDFSDRLFLVHLVPLADVGLYSLGYKIAAIITLITMSFRVAWTPLSHDIASDDDAPLFYGNVLKLYLAGLFTLAVFLALFAKEVILLVAETTYVSSARIVGILAFSYILYGALPVAGIGLQLKKKQQYMSYAALMAFLSNFVLNYILIRTLGYPGAALATMISYVIAIIAVYHFSESFYPIVFAWKRTILFILLCAAIILTGIFADIHLDFIPAVIIKILLASFTVIFLPVAKIITIKQIIAFSKKLFPNAF